MSRNSNRKLKAVFCFFIGGLISGITLFILIKIIQPATLWYFHHEYWVRPTYKNFLAANISGILLFYLSRLYSLTKGWIISPRAIPFPYQFIMVGSFTIINSLMFYILTDMRFFPASLLLGCFGLALSLSVILWLYSDRWSNVTSFLLFIGCFFAPNIASILGINNSVGYDYPILIPVLMGLCGYWLSLIPLQIKLQK